MPRGYVEGLLWPALQGLLDGSFGKGGEMLLPWSCPYRAHNRLSHGLAALKSCPRSMENVEGLSLQSSSEQWGTEIVKKLKGRLLHGPTVLILYIHIPKNWKGDLKMYLYRATSFTLARGRGNTNVQQQTNGKRKDGISHTVENSVTFKKKEIPIGSTT